LLIDWADEENARWAEMHIRYRSQSFCSGLDSSPNRSLHRAFRSLLTDVTNVWTNLDLCLDNMLITEILMFNT